jgi:hypothetical protein
MRRWGDGVFRLGQIKRAALTADRIWWTIKTKVAHRPYFTVEKERIRKSKEHKYFADHILRFLSMS